MSQPLMRPAASIIAGTPINEPGVVYLYRADPTSHVWLQITNRETLDAVRESNPLNVRKLYTFSVDQLALLAKAPVAVVAAAAAKLDDIERRSATPVASADAVREPTDEQIKAAIVAALNNNTTEMEGYAYFGSNPGVKEDDYEEIADEVVAALKSVRTGEGA